MRKGITPIIAMILLVLILLALGGVFAAWITVTTGTMEEAGTETIEETAELMKRGAVVDNIDCTNGNVFIKNTGSELHTDDISLYVNNALITPIWTEYLYR